MQACRSSSTLCPIDYRGGAAVPEVPVPGSAPDPVLCPPVVSLVPVVLEPELGIVELLELPLVPLLP